MTRRLLVLILCFVVAGCNFDEKREKLEQYIAQVKARPSGEIEALPQIKPYETFTYAALDKRSPFVPPDPEKTVATAVLDNGIRPDANRPKEPLEGFPIDALKMVGTLERDGKMWALIVDKDGALHRVVKGNYVGLNHGKINSITEEKVGITEIVPSPTGGWQERQSDMVLTAEETVTKE
ncbi:pilus assembly protein PilP [Candidatus Berkiella cookevillensis]|uniref:Pilus assembly protein PilP n=1 Tax=Candidatus Berkiella cookevillensis TaxID=437022 RepID=A0A0Q9YDA6_9GAMM|nr:pilus assembly protein PilP [Candidatus Berkiella cookevillensis]MCS5709585.1 pilus assembly protein PilP [Candidatus Berkiella cookevillensis]